MSETARWRSCRITGCRSLTRLQREPDRQSGIYCRKLLGTRLFRFFGGMRCCVFTSEQIASPRIAKN
jgi:hypothetical protein